MESYNLNIYERDNGQLWHQKTILTANGPVLTISNKPAFQNVKRRITDFIHLAVATNGYQIAASDSISNVYLFDFKKKRFSRICNLGPYYCTALAFVPNKQYDLLVGLSNNLINIWNTRNCSLTHKSPLAHKNSVHHISVNKDGTKAVTSSIEEAIIWDLTKKLSVTYKLIHSEKNDILKVFFLPVKDYLVCSFKTSLVCLWNSENFKLLRKFTCFENDSIWLKTIEASHDGKIIICGGRSFFVCLWDVETGSKLKEITLNSIVNVNQILMLSTSYVEKSAPYCFQVLAILDENGQLHFINVATWKEILTFGNGGERMDFLAVFQNQLVVITSSGLLKFYLIDSFFKEPAKFKLKPRLPTPISLSEEPNKRIKYESTTNVKMKDTSDPVMKNLKKLLKKSNEYPSFYRNYIWSQLLSLPKNEEFKNFFDKENENNSLLNSKYEDLDRNFKRIFIMHLSLLTKWCPILKEVDYLPDLIYPFVRLLHKNTQMCFELLVTYISNWCQNWFLFLPLPPHSILYAIENILLYYHRPLLCHFLYYDIPPEVYSFYILQFSFSKVFNGDQWLKLWDHIFSNPPHFVLFIVVAFLILSEDSLFSCKLTKDFYMHFSRPTICVSRVISSAYDLMEHMPSCFETALIVGSFTPLPKAGYPPFTRFTFLEDNFQNTDRQKLLGEEVNSYIQELTEHNLEELKKLRDMRKKVVTQSFESTSAESYEELEKKVEKLQRLIQFHLINQKENIQSMCEKKFAPKDQSENESLKKVHNMLNLREQLLKDNVPPT